MAEYSSQSISGYNATPPSDDGATTSANTVRWSTHINKIGDPIKTLVEAIDSALVSRFSETPIYGITAAETAASVTPTNYRHLEGHVLRYGTNTTPGTTDMATAFNNAILVMSQNGGVVTVPGEVIGCASAITLRAGVHIKGAGVDQTIIRATAAIAGDFLTGTDADDSQVSDLTIDCNNNVTTYAIDSVTPDGFSVRRVRVKNWNSGIRTASDTTTAAKNIVYEDIDVVDPGTTSIGNAIYVASTTGGQLVEDVWVNRCRVIGVAGAYSASNQQTADQFTFHGVKRGIMRDCVSIDGGEIGFTVSRLSTDVTLDGCHAEGCDADGFSIGSGYVQVDVADASNFAVNDTLTGQTSGAAGTIQAISSNTVYVNSVTGGKYEVGETVSDGSDTSTVSSITRTQRIKVIGCTAKNNAIDADAGGGTLVGFKVQQADDITFNGVQSYDTNVTKNQQYGIWTTQSDNILIGAGNDLVDNLTGTIGVSGSNTFNSAILWSYSNPNIESVIDIASGVITVTGSYHVLDTEADASTDDLDTINGGVDGMRLILRATSSTQTVVVKDGTGNIRLDGGTDFSLDHADDLIELIYRDNISAWVEISRADVSA